MFAAMGQLYPWATPERLLWGMAYSQIALYLRRGYEIKYPETVKTPANMSVTQMTPTQQKTKIERVKEWANRFGVNG